MALILKGAPVCVKMQEELKSEAQKLRLKGVRPKMAILRVGDRGDDISYEKNIEKVCLAADILTEKIHLASDVSQDELKSVIRMVNDDKSVHGLMMFRPLPKHIDEMAICSVIDPKKDIDGITDTSVASVFLGHGNGFAPCTAEACIRLLDYYGIPIAKKRAVIIGRSLVVGKPLAMMLLSRDATVTICHTKTQNMSKLCRDADILIAAAGRSQLVTAEFVNDGQSIVDVGFNVDADGNVTGDVNFSEVERFVSAISPVPAGVGGITARILAEHTVIAAKAVAEKN